MTNIPSQVNLAPNPQENPDKSFREDSLGILRALRLASVFDMKIEAETAEAIHRNKHLLVGADPEHVNAELTELLCGENVKKILSEFADVLAVPLPELEPMFGFEQHNPHHDKDVWLHTVAVVDSIAPEPVLRWAALLHDVGKPECFSLGKDGVGHFYGHAKLSTEIAKNIFSRLHFDDFSRERILRLIRYHDLPIGPEKKRLERLLSKHGPEVVYQLIELHRADTMGLAEMCMHRLERYDAVSTMVNELLTEQPAFSLKDLKIDGNDLMAMGLKGREIGDMLKLCLNAVLDEQVENERDALLKFVQQHRISI